MKCIVPLAGPDFLLPSGLVRSLTPVDGQPLLLKALHSRPWYIGGELQSEDFIFILRQTKATESFRGFLNECFPGSRSITLSHLSQGALMSAMAGVSLIKDQRQPLCIDLADILYEADFSPSKMFEESSAGGIIPYFDSVNEKFSYLRLDHGKHVLETSEKRVISRHASAGTYFYRSASVFCEAVIGTLRSQETTNGIYFVCPSYNSLIREKKYNIKAEEVKNVNPISLTFH